MYETVNRGKNNNKYIGDALGIVVWTETIGIDSHYV